MQRHSNPSNIKIQMNNFTLNLQTLLPKDQQKQLPTTYRKSNKTQRIKTNYNDISPLKVQIKNKDNNVVNKANKVKKQEFINIGDLKHLSKTTKLNTQKKQKKPEKSQELKNIKKTKPTESLVKETRSKNKKQKSTRLQRHFTDYDHVIQSARLRTSPSINFMNNNFKTQQISKSGSKSRSKSFKKKENKKKSRTKSTLSGNYNERLSTRKSVEKYGLGNKKVKQSHYEESSPFNQTKKRRLSKSKQRRSIDNLHNKFNKSKSRQRIYTQMQDKNYVYNNKHLNSNNLAQDNYENRISLSHKKGKVHHYRQQSQNLMSHSSDNGLLGPKFASNKINSKEKVKQKSVNNAKIKTKKLSNTQSMSNIQKGTTKKMMASSKKQSSNKTSQKQSIKQKTSMSSQFNFYQSTNVQKHKLTEDDLNNYFEKSINKKKKKLKTFHDEDDFEQHGLSSIKKGKKDDKNEIMEMAFKKKKVKNVVEKLFGVEAGDKKQQVTRPGKIKENMKDTQRYEHQMNDEDEIKKAKPRLTKGKKLTIQTTFQHEEKRQLYFDDISKILYRQRDKQNESDHSRHSICRSERSIKEEIMQNHMRSKDMADHDYTNRQQLGQYDGQVMQISEVYNKGNGYYQWSRDRVNLAGYSEQSDNHIIKLKTEQLEDSQSEDKDSLDSSQQDSNQNESSQGEEQQEMSDQEDSDDGHQVREDHADHDWTSRDHQMHDFSLGNDPNIFQQKKKEKPKRKQEDKEQGSDQELSELKKLNSKLHSVDLNAINRSNYYQSYMVQTLPYGVQNKQKVLSSLNKPRKSVDEQYKIAKALSNNKLLQQLELLQTLSKIQKSLQNSLLHDHPETQLTNQIKHLSFNQTHNNLYPNMFIHKEYLTNKSNKEYLTNKSNNDYLTNKSNKEYSSNKELLNNISNKNILQVQHHILQSPKQFITRQNKKIEQQNPKQANQSISSVVQPSESPQKQSTNKLILENLQQKEDSPLLSENQFRRSSPINVFDSLQSPSYKGTQWDNVNPFNQDNNFRPIHNDKDSLLPSNQQNLLTDHLKTIKNNQQVLIQANLPNYDSAELQLQLYSQSQKNSLDVKRGQYSQLSLQFEKQMDDYLKDNQSKNTSIIQLKPVQQSAPNLQTATKKEPSAQQSYDVSDEFFYLNKNQKQHINIQQQPHQNIGISQKEQPPHSELIQSQLTQYILSQIIKQFTTVLTKRQTLLHRFLHHASQLDMEPFSDHQQQKPFQITKKKPIFDPFQALDQRQINQNQFVEYLQSKIYANNDYILNLAYELFGFVKKSSQHEDIFLTNINRSFGLKPLKTLKWMRKAYSQNDQKQDQYHQDQQNSKQQQNSQDKDSQMSELSQNQQLEAVLSPILLADFDAAQNQMILEQINEEQYYLNHAVYASLNEICDSYRPYGQNGPPVIPKQKPIFNTSISLIQPKIFSRFQRVLSLRMGRTQFSPDEEPEKIIPQSYKKMDEMIVEEQHEKWTQRNLQDLIFESKYYLAMYILDLIFNQQVMEMFRLLYG